MDQRTAEDPPIVRNGSSDDEDTVDEESDGELETLRKDNMNWRARLEFLMSKFEEYREIHQDLPVENDRLRLELQVCRTERDSYERQFEEMVEEYELQIGVLEKDRRLKSQENVENLQLLITEMTNIENTNAELELRLEDEKERNRTITEELRLTKIMVEKTREQLTEKKKERTGEYVEGGMVAMVKRMEEMGRLATQLHRLAFDHESNTETDRWEHLYMEEKRDNDSLRKALDTERRRLVTANNQNMTLRVSRVLNSQTSPEVPSQPRLVRGTLRKPVRSESMTHTNAETLRRAGSSSDTQTIREAIMNYNVAGPALKNSMKRSNTVTPPRAKAPSLQGSQALPPTHPNSSVHLDLSPLHKETSTPQEPQVDSPDMAHRTNEKKRGETVKEGGESPQTSPKMEGESTTKGTRPRKEDKKSPRTRVKANTSRSSDVKSRSPRSSALKKAEANQSTRSLGSSHGGDSMGSDSESDDDAKNDGATSNESPPEKGSGNRKIEEMKTRIRKVATMDDEPSYHVHKRASSQIITSSPSSSSEGLKRSPKIDAQIEVFEKMSTKPSRSSFNLGNIFGFSTKSPPKSRK